jgi:hypothetical protein
MAASAESLRDTAADPERLELVLGLDADDETGSAYLQAVTAVPRRVYWFQHRHGYRHLHRYYNDLAEEAGGQWLVLWNDDARMARRGWDLAIREQDPRKLAALNITSEQPGGMNLFPVVTRRWFDVVGHLSRQAHTDTWIQDVSRAAGVERNERRVVVEHLREGDGDAIYAVTSPEFYSPAFTDLRAIDADKLREAVRG